MRRASCFVVFLGVLAVITAFSTAVAPAYAQRHPPTAGHAVPRPPVRHGAVIFVGGYFYDPMFGQYPWWPRPAYPYPYYPAFGHRAVLRIIDAPKNAAVYVDGFYAGIVDDFDGFFEGLPLPAGGHEVVLYLDGYRTVRRQLYLSPGSALKLHETMKPLSAGEVSEPPTVVPPLPPPPEGTYISLRTMGPVYPAPAQASSPTASTAFGTLSLHVQPVAAEIWIDGECWASVEDGSFLIHVPAGRHHVEVVTPGYGRYATDVQVSGGEIVPLNVSLIREKAE